MKKLLKRNLELLYEIGCLRFMPRSWQRFLNTDFQNLAEHHLRVTWITLVLAKMEGAKNTDKMMKMALMHDISESRTGDLDWLQHKYVKRDEDMSIQDMLSGTSLENEFLNLWNEYEERKTIESKIVKDADSIDVDIELKEQEANGSTLRKHFRAGRKFTAKNKLHTKSAKKMWNLIQKSDPHSWYALGVESYSGRNWKKNK